jgi:hypothetical protein
MPKMFALMNEATAMALLELVDPDDPKLPEVLDPVWVRARLPPAVGEVAAIMWRKAEVDTDDHVWSLVGEFIVDATVEWDLDEEVIRFDKAQVEALHAFGCGLYDAPDGYYPNFEELECEGDGDFEEDDDFADDDFDSDGGDA